MSTKTIEEYKEECKRLEGVNLDLNLTCRRQEQVIQELRMSLGFYRNAIRQGQNVEKEIVAAVPEAWEPNVNYNNPDKPQFN